ncbi:hypothetical protein ACP70R_020868 [Stipagrostis hirtigluma subsp. patula]
MQHKDKASRSERSRRFFVVSQLPGCDGWRQRYFFLSSPTGSWQCPVKWGQSTANCEPQHDHEAKIDVEKLRVKKIDLMSLLSDQKLAAAYAAAGEVKMVSDAGTKVAEMEQSASARPATSKRKSPASDQSPPPALPVWSTVKVLKKKLKDSLVGAIDVVQEENTSLRSALAKANAEVTKAKDSEAAAKAELAKVREAAKAKVTEAKDSEAAAKAKLAKVREAAQAELAKIRKEAEAEVAEAREAETAAKDELAKARKSEMAAKAELSKVRKSQDAKLQELKECCKAKLQMFNDELMKTFDSVLDTAIESVKDVAAVTATPSAYPGK